jgi:peptidoglycan/LPS O-acetylase OafA/YrhL
MKIAGAPRSKTRISSLDGIRGIAILSVLFHHLCSGLSGDTPGLGPFIRFFTNEGNLGVDLFFVLSGFLITGILLDTKGKPGFFRNFYMRRTLRIFPLYYGVLLIFLVLLPEGVRLLGRQPPILEHSSWWLWLYGLNFLVAKLNTWNVGPVLGSMLPFWSLCVEEHFYLLWPVLIFIAPVRYLKWFLGLVILSAIGLRCYWALHYQGPQLISSVLMPFRMDSLACGGLAAWLWRLPLRERAINKAAAVTLIVTGIGFACGIWVGWNPGSVGLNALWRFPILEFGSAAAILLSVTLSPSTLLNQILSASWLRFFGRYSYGLYVYHFFVISYGRKPMLYWAGTFLANSVASALLASALLLGVSLGIAVASWHVYEKPILRLKRYFE